MGGHSNPCGRGLHRRAPPKSSGTALESQKGSGREKTSQSHVLIHVGEQHRPQGGGAVATDLLPAEDQGGALVKAQIASLLEPLENRTSNLRACEDGGFWQKFFLKPKTLWYKP